MVKLKILCVFTFMLFHCASLMPMEDLNNSNSNNLIHLKDNELIENVASVEADENVPAIGQNAIEGAEIKENTNRTKRQFYSDQPQSHIAKDFYPYPNIAKLPLLCGLTGIDISDHASIVGGIVSSSSDFPWIAALTRGGKCVCSGSLITNRHILTAAHCVARLNSSELAEVRVNLGDFNIYTDSKNRYVTRSIKNAVVHKDYPINILYNDIAILTLNAAVNFNLHIQPVCLPTSLFQLNSDYTGQTGTVGGWGRIYAGGPQSSTLQTVKVPVWSNAECTQIYSIAGRPPILSSLLCAGNIGKGPCNGDSGGPLVIKDDGQHVQIGIISCGLGCSMDIFPTVYTRITSLMPWILANID